MDTVVLLSPLSGKLVMSTGDSLKNDGESQEGECKISMVTACNSYCRKLKIPLACKHVCRFVVKLDILTFVHIDRSLIFAKLFCI